MRPPDTKFGNYCRVGNSFFSTRLSRILVSGSDSNRIRSNAIRRVRVLTSVVGGGGGGRGDVHVLSGDAVTHFAADSPSFVAIVTFSTGATPRRSLSSNSTRANEVEESWQLARSAAAAAGGRRQSTFESKLVVAQYLTRFRLLFRCQPKAKPSRPPRGRRRSAQSTL